MRRLLVLALVLFASGASAQTMYKCVDARGVTHYSDKPLPGCKGREVNIQGQPPISGTLSAPGENFRRDEQGFQRRRIAEERDREAELHAVEEQKRRCGELLAEVRRLDFGRRLVELDEKGGLAYVDDEERNRRASRLRDEIAQKCR
jgi:hypothetical protein